MTTAYGNPDTFIVLSQLVDDHHKPPHRPMGQLFLLQTCISYRRKADRVAAGEDGFPACLTFYYHIIINGLKESYLCDILLRRNKTWR